MERIGIGDRIGGLYEVREILESGMGIVYICYYRWHQKLYALKTYQDKYFTSKRVRDNFYREATLWMTLESHPNIVQAHWVHNLDGKIYVVMEYIPKDTSGRVTLNDHLIEEKPLPFLRTLIWAIQFCYGMEYAHSRGVLVHRDIKPHNILITLDNTLKITDFGLAKAFDVEDPLSGSVAGTPYWMSPEQFEDAGSCTVRSDIYSFGVVLYQMVSGHLPFKDIPASGPHLFEAIRYLHTRSPIIRLDSELFPIIEKCLSKKPNERWGDFEELRNELQVLWTKKTDIPLPKSLEAMPLGAKEINQKGVAMKHLGRPKEAIHYHNKALEINPTFANAWNDKGIALWDVGEHKEALDCFNKAIEIDPEFVHPRNNKAGLLSELAHYQEALDCYEEALKIDPEFIYLWRGKGDILFEMGKERDFYAKVAHYRSAIRCYDEALKINKRDIWALHKRDIVSQALQDMGSASGP